MSNSNSDFLAAAKEYERLKTELEDVKDQMDFHAKQIGAGTYLQDPVTLTVYKIVIPRGKFVPYESVSYERTALEGETRGTLSKKEANEKGFSLTKE